MASRGLGRFRVSVYRQRGTTAMVFRSISFDHPVAGQGSICRRSCRRSARRSAAWSWSPAPPARGKSTTLAAMIDYINENRTCNIITIEDPVEFLHRDNKSIISQREVGSIRPPSQAPSRAPCGRTRT